MTRLALLAVVTYGFVAHAYAMGSPLDGGGGGGGGGVSLSESQAVKRSIIQQLAAQFHMDPGDLESSSITVQSVPASPESGGVTKFHAVGSFVLEWDQPKNAYDAINLRLQQNVCAVAPADQCKHGIRHTVYLDVVATAGADGHDFALAGEAELDQTIAEAKQRQAEAAEDTAKFEKQQALAQQREQAKHDLIVQQQKDQEKARLEALQRRRTLQEFRRRQQDEMRAALADLEARQQKDKVDLDTQISQLREQQQRQESVQARTRSGGYTLSMERLEQAQNAPLNAELSQLQRRQQSMYQTRQRERQELVGQIQARQAQDYQRFVEQLAAGSEIPSSASGYAPVDQAASAPPADARSQVEERTGDAVAGPSFDCKKASTQTELAICGSPELSQLDGQVGNLYRALLSATPPERRQGLILDQRHWIVDRGRECGGDVACLSSSLVLRASTLRRRAP